MQTKINPKSYVTIKYLFTFSMLLMYLIGFMALIASTTRSENKLEHWSSVYYFKITIVFLALSLCFGLTYLLIRIFIHKKSTYKFTPLEKQKIYINFGLYFVAVLISVLMICSILLTTKVFFILAILSLIVLIIFGIFISLLEAVITAKEQVVVTKMWNEINTASTSEIPAKNSDVQIVEQQKKADKKNPFMED